jgi:uncharacterized protein YecE (DUF72 family)
MPPDPASTASALERYTREFDAVEVNSSFYRHHRESTWARWAASTPDDFRFAVKLPRAITHEAKLDVAGSRDVLDRFLGEVAQLGGKLGPLLVQLPPSLEFDAARATAFLDELRTRHDGDVVLEPRNASWFEEAADELLVHWRIARVAADPAKVPAAADPGGWRELAYARLHGSPRMYYSSYDAEAIRYTAQLLEQSGADRAWCVFDNTASGAALDNARELRAALS